MVIVVGCGCTGGWYVLVGWLLSDGIDPNKSREQFLNFTLFACPTTSISQ
jgi:hypothetical protein